MLDLKSLSAQIEELTAGRTTIAQFEAWFLQHADNVHVWADDLTLEVVQIVDGHFDELRFGGLSRGEFLASLQNTAVVFRDLARLAVE